MLQYGDLSVRDISFYWMGSILLYERSGVKIPCKIMEVQGGGERYPVVLSDMRTGERLVSLRLSTFVRKCLVHHPALGYGDYEGIPLYLSTSAGRTLRKGVDSSNLRVLCPIDWKGAIITRMKELSKQAIKLVDNGKKLSTKLSEEYQKLQQYVGGTSTSTSGLQYFTAARRRQGAPGAQDGGVRVKSPNMLADTIHQCVNNLYPTLQEAIDRMTAKDVAGVSLSRDFAIFKASTAPKNTYVLYHKMAYIGDVNINTGAVGYVKTLNAATRKTLSLAFNRVRR
jgi:hypothetical protein